MAPIVPCPTMVQSALVRCVTTILEAGSLSPVFSRLHRSVRQHWRDLAACALLVIAAVVVLRGPILRGEIFLPLDLLPHMPPWSYSYERTAVANAAPSDLILEYLPAPFAGDPVDARRTAPALEPVCARGHAVAGRWLFGIAVPIQRSIRHIASRHCLWLVCAATSDAGRSGGLLAGACAGPCPRGSAARRYRLHGQRLRDGLVAVP